VGKKLGWITLKKGTDKFCWNMYVGYKNKPTDYDVPDENFTRSEYRNA
jgi:hypothetical protein